MVIHLKSSTLLYSFCILLLILSSVPIASAAEGYSYSNRWGSYGQGNGYFQGSEGIAVDAMGNVYVVDSGNSRIQKFSSTGSFIAKWGFSGSKDGQFSSPKDVAVDNAGNVYVADSANQRIQKFTSDGTFITEWGTSGNEDGQFLWAAGITVDSAGNIYVADTGNNRIQKFSSTGAFITKWGYPGDRDEEFERPVDVAVDSAGNVYVTDTGNYRIQKFTSSGDLITSWGHRGSEDGLFSNLNGIAVDKADNVFVTDSGNSRIQKFTSTGTFIGSFGNDERIDPRWVAVDSSGNVYFTESNKIQQYSPGGSTPLSGSNTKVTTTTNKPGISSATISPTSSGGGNGGGNQSPDYLMIFIVVAGIAVIGGIIVTGRKRGKPAPKRAQLTKTPISKRILPSLGKTKSPMEGNQSTQGVINRDVMISYSQPDKQIADEMCAGLEARGISCWIAPRNIPPGTEYQEAIVDAIDGSKVFVLVLSSHSNESPYVKREVTLALSKRVTIIPVRIEDVPPSKTMEFLISTPQWIDAYTPPLAQHIAHLADSVQKILDSQK